MSVLDIENFYKSFPTLSHNRNRFPFEKTINYNMKMGEITPITIIPVVPGQTYNLDLSTVIKVAPLQVPPQDDAIFKTFAFYGANRISWENYPYWFGQKKNPEDPENEQTYLVPKVELPTSYEVEEENENGKTVTVTKEGFPYNSFYDNIGCPPEKGGYKIDKYIVNLDRDIYNNYFRNQSLENPLLIDRTDADLDPWDNMYLRKIAKPRDLFTSCLPTVNGTTPVEIPLGSTAPVIGNGNILGLNMTYNGTNYPNTALQKTSGNNIALVPFEKTAPVGTNMSGEMIGHDRPVYGIGVSENSKNSGLIADLTKAMGAPLEGLYQAIAYNTYQYLTSRGGNRYFEQISNIYGTVNPEGVLQMSEFLGSSSQMIEFDTVTQTSNTTGQDAPMGNRVANGYCQDYRNIINKSFGEFGWIIIYGVVTHYPKYQQGVTKLLQTEDKLDLFNPLFNLIGDEAIKQSEIYVQPDTVVDENGEPVNDKIFGYNKRNSRYLFPVNEIHGEQRSSYKQSLDANHFAEYYTEAPILNKEFDKVNDNAFKRALQITDEVQFICNSMITGTQDIEIPRESLPSPFPNIQIQGF